MVSYVVSRGGGVSSVGNNRPSRNGQKCLPFRTKPFSLVVYNNYDLLGSNQSMDIWIVPLFRANIDIVVDDCAILILWFNISLYSLDSLDPYLIITIFGTIREIGGPLLYICPTVVWLNEQLHNGCEGIHVRCWIFCAIWSLYIIITKRRSAWVGWLVGLYRSDWEVVQANRGEQDDIAVVIVVPLPIMRIIRIDKAKPEFKTLVTTWTNSNYLHSHPQELSKN